MASEVGLSYNQTEKANKNVTKNGKTKHNQITTGLT